jgi:hypothetical protein
MFSLPKELWDKAWSSVIKMDTASAQDFFLENASDLHYQESAVFEGLKERQIGELYILLSRLFPAETDPHQIVGQVYTVSSRHEMQRLRDGCIETLVRRATALSLEQLEVLSMKAPKTQRIPLKRSYGVALKNRLSALWTAGAPSPREILSLARSNAARRVEDEDSLQEAVLLSLGRLQAEMDGDRLPSARDLWNEADGRHLAKPKREEELSHMVRRWLSKDLPANTGIIVNCEVKVERFGHGKLDIKVEAVSKDKLAARRLALIIEVKRCSHPNVATACKTQLAKGYLADQGLTHGIYLVGWYGLKSGQTSKWRSRMDAEKCVENWANTSIQGLLTVKGFVLDCRLPNLAAPSRCKRNVRCK